MGEADKFLYIIGFACLVSVLLTTSFVAMVMAKSVKARPELFSMHPDFLDIAEKYSKATFVVSCFMAILVYMYGAIMLLFHFLPAAIAAAFG